MSINDVMISRVNSKDFILFIDILLRNIRTPLILNLFIQPIKNGKKAIVVLFFTIILKANLLTDGDLPMGK